VIVYQAIRRHIAEDSNFHKKNFWMNFSVQPRITSLTTIHLLGEKKAHETCISALILCTWCSVKRYHCFLAKLCALLVHIRRGLKYSSVVEPLLNRYIQRYAESLTLKTQCLCLFTLLLLLLLLSSLLCQILLRVLRQFFLN